MPSAQVINFGEDPTANSIGGFAKNFLKTIEDKTEQRRNDEIFKRISDNYGPGTKTEDFLRDVIKSEGLGNDYKKDKIKELTDFATLKNKSDQNGYELSKLQQRQDDLKSRERKNDLAEKRLDIDKDEAKRRNDKAGRDSANDITKYNKDIIERSRLRNLSASELAAFDDITGQYVNGFEGEEPLSLPAASAKALQFVQDRREYLDDLATITKPSFYGVDGEALDNAFNELLEIYQTYHPTQKELMRIAKKSFNDNFSTKLVQKVLQADGKKMRATSKKFKEEDSENQAAEDAKLLGL